MAAGRMQPAGLVEIEAAKMDGRWDAASSSARVSRPRQEMIVGPHSPRFCRKTFNVLSQLHRAL